MILAVGEALMEFRRETPDGRLAAPGSWAGPFPSGAPAIFASVAARLGARTGLAACVGGDAFGRALIERLLRDEVDAHGVRIEPRRATATAFVAYDEHGDRSFWFSVYDSAAMELDVQSAERLAERADWLHVSGSTLGFGGRPARAVEAAAVRVIERGGRLSLDPNVRSDADGEVRERTARLARAAHVLFPSQGELAAVGLEAGELADRGAIVCETRGRNGALLFSGPTAGAPVPIPVAEAAEVDATGAGDTFAAAFVTALRDGADARSAATFACEIAARSVGVTGAMEAPIEPRPGTRSLRDVR
jgi:fructokinase